MITSQATNLQRLGGAHLIRNYHRHLMLHSYHMSRWIASGDLWVFGNGESSKHLASYKSSLGQT